MGLRGFVAKIKQGLAKTRNVFGGVVELLRFKGRVDKQYLAELEKSLYLADVGSFATQQIVERVRLALQDKEITGDVQAFVKDQLKQLLAAPESGVHHAPAGPTVIMIAGVNRSGK